MKKLRLHQFLSKSALFPLKQQIYDAIKNGEVTVKGVTITNPEYQIKPNVDVCYKNKKVVIEKKKEYIAINKPAGYLSSKLSKKDIELGKKSVFDLLDTIDEKTKNTLFCIGRLDEDTSGLLILSNDGKLGNTMTDPKFEKTKKYEVTLKNPFAPEDKKELESGVNIELEENGVVTTYHTKPCAIEIVSKNKIIIELTEGKKRQIRRMILAVGNLVVLLKRISIGSLTLDALDIPEGKYKTITQAMILENS